MAAAEQQQIKRFPMDRIGNIGENVSVPVAGQRAPVIQRNDNWSQ